MGILDELTTILEARRRADPESSYVAALYQSGLNRILEKVAEEAAETLLAAKDHNAPGRDDDLIHEVADLWFHTLVLLVHLDQKPAWVLEELGRRFGMSGHAEKAARNTPENR